MHKDVWCLNIVLLSKERFLGNVVEVDERYVIVCE